MGQTYDIVDIAEDIGKFGYSVGIFACKAFYQVSELEALKKSMDAYTVSRFSQRLEYFTHEHDKLSDDEKKEFYEDLKYNKQNINYLYEFIEKSRTSILEIHAKIYAKLSANLVQNKKLNYFENNLLTNLNILNHEDLIKIKEVLNSNSIDMENFGRRYNFKIETYDDKSTFNKCLQLGIFITFEEPSVIYNEVAVKGNAPLKNAAFRLTPYAEIFKNILEDVFNE